ncbi:MAG: putative zinc-binding metallopeptidase [Planctomycetaceae bacterium]|nr:putative zinc-binding metallopeptidase [Planctomycetaceae bacterium]MCA9111911.1 putative zinc-binding metallopeptidase [Planctomycetaceae bacterium]
MSVNGHDRRRKSQRRSQFGNPDLAQLSDEELLDLRFCDLKLTIEGTPLEVRIDQLSRELDAKKLSFRPHFWLSEEWFTPDGVPGVAIPFYLADSRLMRLEEQQMFEVEGGTAEWCMRILRHEAGHAIDNAYRLRRRSGYRKVFGNVSTPYPESYNPQPYSHRFVVNLDLWYAQSHPVEDFAETFAVWLKPRSRWRQVYHDWPALKKIEYVDGLMKEIREERPCVRSRKHEEPLRLNRNTLREHYADKRDHYRIEVADSYDHELRRLFCDDPSCEGLPSAATFLRRIRRRSRRDVAEWTGQFQYIIDQVLGEMIQRCRELKLRVDRPAEEVERDVLVVLTMHTMNYIQDEAHKIAL